MGVLYATGEGVDKDYQKAFTYFELSAKEGNASAQFHLGIIYHDGLGVPQDLEEAARYFKLAADQGYTGK